MSEPAFQFDYERRITELIAERDALKAQLAEYKGRSTRFRDEQRDRADRAETERDKLAAETVALKECGLIMTDEWNAEKQRADRAEAAAAQMREALEETKRFIAGLRTILPWEHWKGTGSLCDQITEALATEAGRSFVPIEDVRPLLALIEETHFGGNDGARKMAVLKTFLAKHAEKLNEAK